MSRQVERPPRRWRARAVGALIGSALLFGVAATAMAVPDIQQSTPTSAAPPEGQGVTPVLLNPGAVGNPNRSCEDLKTAGLIGNYIEYKSDYNGTFQTPFPSFIDVTVTGGTFVAFESDVPVLAAIVKGGAEANIYDYDPPAVTFDSGLASPPVGAGQNPAGLSNLTFCFQDLPEVKITKWVEGLSPESDENPWPSFTFTFTPVDDGVPADEPVASLDVKANSKESIFLAPGKYLVTELGVGPDSDYELLWANCRTKGYYVSSESENGTKPLNPQEITVPESGKVKCTFKNAKTPKLIVDKVVTGGEGDSTKFDFTLTGEFPLPEVEESVPAEAPVWPTIDDVAFQLANGESTTLPLRAPECVPYLNSLDSVETQGIFYKCPKVSAQYTLTELPVPEGYEFVDLVCDPDVVRPVEENGGIEPKIDGPVATFGDIDYGTVIRCTYTNLKLPKLTVTKALTNGSGDGLTTPFPFSITGQPDFSLTGGQSDGPRILPVGTYTVGEGTVPAGFTFTSASCTKPGTANGQAITLDLAAGDDVTCTFTNNQTPPPPPSEITGTPEPPPTVVTQVRNPRLAIVKTGPLRARPLQRFNYTIRVRNPGRAVARNVVITDVLPSGLIYVRSSRRATVRGRTITIPMGNLQPGQARSVRVTVRAAANVRGRKVNVAIARATNVRPVRDTAPTVFRPIVRRIVPAVTG